MDSHPCGLVWKFGPRRSVRDDLMRISLHGKMRVSFNYFRWSGLFQIPCDVSKVLKILNSISDETEECLRVKGTV